ncbi:MAG: hypothetical protein U0703_05320 [Anaerolineae bacterium]
MYRNRIKPGAFARPDDRGNPVSLFDSAPDADGAAAVVLTSAGRAGDLVPQPIRIIGSGAASGTLALHDRDDLLSLKAVAVDAQGAGAGGHRPRRHRSAGTARRFHHLGVRWRWKPPGSPSVA